VSPAGWIFLGLLLLSGLAATTSLARAGIRYLWSSGGRSAPHVKGVEAVAILVLLFAGVLLAIFAEPVTRYTTATAAGLHAPRPYVDTVLSTKARPRPTQSDVDPKTSP
jgi:multicomponent K+:H+ antiporter subunit D